MKEKKKKVKFIYTCINCETKQFKKDVNQLLNKGVDLRKIPCKECGKYKIYIEEEQEAMDWEEVLKVHGLTAYDLLDFYNENINHLNNELKNNKDLSKKLIKDFKRMIKLYTESKKNHLINMKERGHKI